jgi:hypothetical protein
MHTGDEARPLTRIGEAQRGIGANRCRIPSLVASLMFVSWCSVPLAQVTPGNHLADPPLTSSSTDTSAQLGSPQQSERERISEEFRTRVLTADDPRSHWVAGQFSKMDPDVQVHHFALARVAAPSEKLYLASLATACLQRIRPQPDDCARTDRLADWALRDEDNGIPYIYLADQARKRGDIDAMTGYIVHASDAARFDDYWSRGVLAFYDAIQSMRMVGDPLDRSIVALGYGAEQPSDIGTALRRVCLESQARPAAVREGCARLGAKMESQATTLQARSVGTSVLAGNAPDAGAQTRAQTQQLALQSRMNQCNGLQQAAGDTDANDGAAHARALAAVDDWIHAQARYGEVNACERLLAVAAKRTSVSMASGGLASTSEAVLPNAGSTNGK